MNSRKSEASDAKPTNHTKLKWTEIREKGI